MPKSFPDHPDGPPPPDLVFLVDDIAFWTTSSNRDAFLSAMRQAREWGLDLDQIEALFRNTYEAAARNGHELENRWW